MTLKSPDPARHAVGDSFNRVLYILLALTIGVMGSGYLLIDSFQLWNRPELGMELLKAFIQIATVLVLGQVVGLLVKRWEAERAGADKDLDRQRAEAQQERDRQRARQDARRETLKDWHRRLIDAHVAISLGWREAKAPS